MLGWIEAHSSALQVLTGAITVLIWIVYLQLFLMSYLRQRRPEILIGIGAGVGFETRCFVANLGHEPIYVMDMTLTLCSDGHEESAFITDRSEMSRKDLTDPRGATNQGPLKSGDYYDIGSFQDLVGRAERALDRAIDRDSIETLQVMVIANTAASASIVAAYRVFRLTGTADDRRIGSTHVETTQIHSFLTRRRLKRSLQRQLDGGPLVSPALYRTRSSRWW